VGSKINRILLLIFFLLISIIWFYLKDNRHIFNFIFQEKEIRVILKNQTDETSVLRIQEGTRVRDVLKIVNYEVINSENPELDRQLSDGDFIDLKKGF